MAAKNSIKLYVDDGYYHLYNRGVAKTPVFLDEQDYGVFLSYLKEYLIPSPSLDAMDLDEINKKRIYIRRNYSDEIDLLIFCLMPNHFHLLLKQKETRSIEFFMRSLLVRYASYFNKRYQRVGHLFQDVYKGILIQREEYWLWLSRYIHRNPIDLLKPGQKLEDYSYSSYPNYLGVRMSEWVKTEEILAMFTNYQEFVEGPEEKQTDNLKSELQTYTLEQQNPA